MQNMAHKRGESKPRLETKKVFKYFGNQKLCCSNSNDSKLLLLLKAAGLWSRFSASSFLNIHSRQTIFQLCPIFLRKQFLYKEAVFQCLLPCGINYCNVSGKKLVDTQCCLAYFYDLGCF